MRVSQGSKSTSKFKKNAISKFPCPIGCGDNYWAASNCYQFRNKMSKKERFDRVRIDNLRLFEHVRIIQESFWEKGFLLPGIS